MKRKDEEPTAYTLLQCAIIAYILGNIFIVLSDLIPIEKAEWAFFNLWFEIPFYWAIMMMARNNVRRRK